MSPPMDVGRAGAALSGPGIDTRDWLLKAVVIAEPFVDPRAGYLCRVMLLTPSQDEVLASVCTLYAGAGFGFFAPLRVDDIVIVGNPGGLPDEGWYVMGRCWQRSDPPPGEVADAPSDLLLLVEEGRSITVAVQGSGDVRVEARGDGDVVVEAGGDVLLGTDGASAGVARVGDQVAIRNADIATLQTALDARYVLNPGPVPIPPLPGVTGVITEGSTKVKAS